MLPRIVRSPVEICFGTSPSQAAKSRPLENTSPLPIAATMALEMIGPMPGTLINRSHAGSLQASAPISLDRASMRLSSGCQSCASPSMRCSVRSDKTVSAFGENAGQFGAQEPQPLPYCNPALQQEGAYLVDDAGALADQSLAHTVQGLQVELIGGFRGDELHRRPLHRLGDGLGITEVVLLSLRIRGARISPASAERRGQSPAVCD
jgi:hypothetical protein